MHDSGYSNFEDIQLVVNPLLPNHYAHSREQISINLHFLEMKIYPVCNEPSD